MRKNMLLIASYAAVLLGSFTSTVSAQVTVSVGYLNNLTGSPNPADVPTPFDPSETTILISSGGATTPHDTGVIRFDNRSGIPVSVERGLRVTVERAVFQIWDNALPTVLAPGKTLVLAETNNFNFDSSDSGLNAVPVLTGSINGRSFSFTDNTRVLLGREDAGNTAETTPYHELGTLDVTIAQTFATAAARCDDMTAKSTLTTFAQAFDAQVRTPTLSGLANAGANASIIDSTRILLDAKSEELAKILTTAISSSSARLVQPSSLFNDVLLTTPQQVDVTNILPPVSTPDIRTRQTISNILTTGFDPDQISLDWGGMASRCTLSPPPGMPGGDFDMANQIDVRVSPRRPGTVNEAVRFNNSSVLISIAQGIEWKCTTKCTKRSDGKTEYTVECSIGGKF